MGLTQGPGENTVYDSVGALAETVEAQGTLHPIDGPMLLQRLGTAMFQETNAPIRVGWCTCIQEPIEKIFAGPADAHMLQAKTGRYLVQRAEFKPDKQKSWEDRFQEWFLGGLDQLRQRFVDVIVGRLK